MVWRQQHDATDLLFMLQVCRLDGGWACFFLQPIFEDLGVGKT